jgi:HK97 family phage prohead protease
MQLERRYRTQEFRVSPQGESPKIAGYAAVFDSPSEDLGWIEEIDPHAFDSVMASAHDVRALWNHNSDVVLGRETAKTLSLSIDARGLAYVIDPPDTQIARDLLVSMRRGDVRESSFGFVVARDQWTDNPDGTVTRRILEFAEIVDVSPVAFPAFTSASAGVRSLPESMPSEYRSRFESRRATHTKTVDGENLTADCFLIVGDPDKTDTWELPWKFSTEEKTKSHLRDALARFDQMKGVSDAEKKKAWAELLKLCKEHDIDVSAEKKSIRALTDQCTCVCAQCISGNCGICSADPQCYGAERSSAQRSADTWHADAMLRLKLAEAS